MNLKPIVRKINPELTLSNSWPLTGGISAEMIALELQDQDGQSQCFILRSYREKSGHDLFREYNTLRAAHSHGLAVPKPVLFDDSQRCFERPYIIMDYVAGEMTFTPVDINARVFQMAEQLSRIPAVNLKHIGELPFISSCTESSEFPVHDSFKSYAARIRELLRHGPLAANPPGLLHGDFWPGNMLWQDGRLSAVIDWEDAQIGDPLIDLARSRSEIAWIFGQRASEEFTKRYQSLAHLDYNDLPYWDLCAALRQIRLLGSDLSFFVDYFSSFGRSDISEASITRDILNFVTQALGKFA